MELNALKKFSLFVNNDCWERINVYFSKPIIKYNSAEYIFNKVRNYLERYKIKEYEFLDFCNIDLDLLEKFCDLLIENKLKINWQSLAIINPSMDEVIFGKMKLAGCRKIIFEIITGSDNLLKKLGLNFSTEDISSILQFAHQSGIFVGINLILGFPLETDENYQQTLEFLIKNTPFINEITKITYCLSNYSRNEIFPFTVPFCKYWEKCLKKEGGIGFLKEDYKYYLFDISKLGIPILNTEPSPYILDYLRDLLKPYLLQKKFLSFIFNNGKGQLFWKNQELTKGLGLYTSIFSSGFWQDSEHADWEVNKVSEEKMILRGKWHTLPIIQIWEIELNEAKFSWRIEMEVLREITIEGEQQTNVMLRNEYENWFSDDGSCGDFINIFNDRWITLFEKKTDQIKSISAIDPKHRFPSISLKYNKSDGDHRLGILNTSSSFSARKLKCYKIDNKKYLPGKYSYFEGEIELGN